MGQRNNRPNIEEFYYSGKGTNRDYTVCEYESTSTLAEKKTNVFTCVDEKFVIPTVLIGISDVVSIVDGKFFVAVTGKC
jgi:hypothetical protein